jgi:hypothetical protein
MRFEFLEPTHSNQQISLKNKNYAKLDKKLSALMKP